MNTLKLLIRSLGFYWRTNLAVLLGVVAGTAVIGGALIVGDSVRGSLRQMTLDRLHHIDHVLHSHRFFREQLAADIAADPSFEERFESIAPALILTGALQYEREQTPSAGQVPQVLRAGQVNLYGLDERLWNMTDHGDTPLPGDGEVILSARVAESLRTNPADPASGVKVGDSVSLWVEVPASIPRDSLLGKRDELSREIELKVAAILPENSGVGRLSLNPNQQLPLNAFLSLKTLQSNLEYLAARRIRKERQIIERPARVNALFVSAKRDADGAGEAASSAAQSLTGISAAHLSLEDLSLRLIAHDEQGYLSLESEQQILGEPFEKAGRAAAASLKLEQAPTLVYLANKIENATDEAKFSRYSVVAGLPLYPPADFDRFNWSGEPPKRPIGGHDVASTKRGEIVLDRWLADDLGVQAGDDVKLWYFVVGDHGELPEEQLLFKVRGVVEMSGTGVDRGLTPEVEGITDVRTFAEWDAPFPMEPVTSRDEEYWDAHRATPKAFITLEAAQGLWHSRYGSLTSLRVGMPTGENPRQQFVDRFFKSLDPAGVDLAFQSVKFTGLQAASGTTDFAGLFFAFSFFLIFAAMILIGLLFRLGIERRGTNIGVLEAVGYAPRQVGRLFFGEGLLVVIVGALVGLAAAYGYASLMVYGLKTWWYGAIQTRFLDVYVTPLSLILGAAISILVAGFAVWWALRQLRYLSARELLAGSTEISLTADRQRRRGRRSRMWAMLCGGLAALLLLGALAGLIPAREAFSGFSWQIVAFFLVGLLLLCASLFALSSWLDADRGTAVSGRGLSGTGSLGLRNASRSRQRSVFTAGLIAWATFVIVAVGAGQRNPATETPDKASGNGGFTLVAESSAPILPDLKTREGQNNLNLIFNEESPQAKLLKEMQVLPFRVKPGEDASCLNIYQTQLPTILGVPQRMIERGGFKFVGADRDNPWTILNERPDDGSIPVFGDMNTLQYSLKKGIGSTVGVPNDEQPEHKLKIAGQFDGSVFQGVLLMSEENFKQVFPNAPAGYSYFLIDVPPVDAGELASVLESGLTEFGFDTERVADRLANFLAVQNTYLSTFQTLGGLGLLLGTFGLATVMLRNVLERRSELALMRAVGFQNSALAWLVLWENAFLLVWGLAAGAISALLAMLPHLRSTGADVPWPSLLIILATVFVVGMLAALFAVREAVRTPILSSLRSE